MVSSVGLSSDWLVSLASFYLRAKFDLSLESLLSEKRWELLQQQAEKQGRK